MDKSTIDKDSVDILFPFRMALLGPMCSGKTFFLCNFIKNLPSVSNITRLPVKQVILHQYPFYVGPGVPITKGYFIYFCEVDILYCYNENTSNENIQASCRTSSVHSLRYFYPQKFTPA